MLNKMANTYPEVDDIKQDLKSLKSHAVELKDHVKADGRERLDRAADRAHEKFDSFKEVGRDKVRHLEAYIQENPVQSIMYAFLGGIAASFLIGRR